MNLGQPQEDYLLINKKEAPILGSVKNKYIVQIQQTFFMAKKYCEEEIKVETT